MRGERSRLSRKKLDTVLLAVRYRSDGRTIALARGIERRGAVWSDLKLFDREALLAQLADGRRIATGRQAALAGDMEVRSMVRQVQSGDQSLLAVNGGDARPAGDALDLPEF